jgi:predicted DNA-binding transcriptional regulator YafY
MNRIDRLFAILLKISDGKLFQADKLAAEFELSERTIYRDMSALIQMGIPIRSEAGVGYQLKDGYFLPPLLFEKEEAIAAGFALKLLTTYMSDSSRESSLNALRKIESVLPKKVRTDYLRELEALDFVPKSLEITFSNEHFRMLMTAIKNRYRVDLEYHTFRKEVPETRQIEPMRLFFAPGQNNWYLEAFCLTRKDWRIFRLDRIVQVTMTETRFLARNREEYQYHAVLPVATSAEVYANPEQARWIREEQHWSFVSEQQHPEGFVVMSYKNFDWHNFISWLCTVNEYIVRIEPEEVRVQLRNKISDLQKLLT